MEKIKSQQSPVNAFATKLSKVTTVKRFPPFIMSYNHVHILSCNKYKLRVRLKSLTTKCTSHAINTDLKSKVNISHL